jgi:hypothetical protein
LKLSLCYGLPSGRGHGCRFEMVGGELELSSEISYAFSNIMKTRNFLLYVYRYIFPVK